MKAHTPVKGRSAPPASGRSPTLRTRLKEATSNAILDAAEEVAAKSGLAGASLQAIAERAGVAVGTIYNYFRDREELFSELFTRRRADMFAALDAKMRSHARAPFRDQLVAYVRALFEHFDAKRVFVRLALENDHLAASLQVSGGRAAGVDEVGHRPAMQQIHERVTRLMRVGIREGVLRPEMADLYPVVFSAIIRGSVLARLNDVSPIAGDTERVVELFLDGAARRASNVVSS